MCLFIASAIEGEFAQCVDGFGVCGRGKNNPSVCEENSPVLLNVSGYFRTETRQDS